MPRVPACPFDALSPRPQFDYRLESARSRAGPTHLPGGDLSRVRLVLSKSSPVLLVGSPMERSCRGHLVLDRKTARRCIRIGAGIAGRTADHRGLGFLVETVPLVLHLLRGGRRDLRRLLDDLRAPSLAALVHPRLRPDDLPNLLSGAGERRDQQLARSVLRPC